jgi:large subunit ribosomal protein L25
MSTNFTIELTPREDFGSSNSRRLRREGMVPVVIYGADKKNAHYVTEHDSLVHILEVEAFHSAIIDVKEAVRNREQFFEKFKCTHTNRK